MLGVRRRPQRSEHHPFGLKVVSDPAVRALLVDKLSAVRAATVGALEIDPGDALAPLTPVRWLAALTQTPVHDAPERAG
jgi:hypothetical protein